MTQLRKPLAIVFGVLIITSIAFVPIGGNFNLVDNAEAGHKCNWAEHSVTGFTSTITLGHVSTSCQQNHVKEMQENDAEQEKLDIYQQVITGQTDSSAFRVTMANGIQTSEPYAWTLAEKAIANAYSNGNTEGLTKTKARTELSDYYSAKQINVLNSFESDMVVWKYLRNVSANETGISESYLHLDNKTRKYSTGSTSITGPNIARIDNVRWGEKNVTLVNDSIYTIETVEVQVTTDPPDHSVSRTNTYELGPSTGTIIQEARGVGEASNVTIWSMEVAPYSTNSDSTTYKDFSEDKELWDSIINKHNEVNTDVGTYVNKTYNAYESGEINASDVVSRITQMQNTANMGGENATFNDMIAALAATGVSTPSLNQTGTMQLSYNENTYSGILFSTENPSSGSWQTGVTYNATQINGSQFFTTLEGNKINLQGEFTLTQMTNMEGDEVNRTVVKEYNYRTANNSELLAKIDALIDLREDVEAREPKAGGGGGSGGSGTNIPDWLTAKYFGIPLYGIILVGLAFAYIANTVRGN